MTNLVTSLYAWMRNKTLNSMGYQRTLEQLLDDGDIGRVKDIMQNRDSIVDAARLEYGPETHKINFAAQRRNKDKYIAERLPRSRQRYINEVEVFFMLGKPIKWSKAAGKGNDELFAEYQQMLRDTRFNSVIRSAKRIAGSETEAALLFRHYQQDGKPHVQVVVLSRSNGYTLRPLFDQYGNLLAFGYGYHLKDGNNTIEHFDVQTPDFIYEATREKVGWQVDKKANPTGKINVVYIQQPKAWEGVQCLIEREENVMSKTADGNNYFADPMAAATADVVNSLPDSNKPGKLIQLSDQNSRFEYINPPSASESQQAEMVSLEKAILFDSFTPDLSFEAMKGMGSISGEAISRAMTIGFIKRDNLLEVYDAAVDRMKNLYLATMAKVTHIRYASQVEELDITHEFSQPFSDDVATRWAEIGRAYSEGIISLEKAVELMGLADNPQEEIDRIKEAKANSQMNDLMGPTF